MEENNNFLYKGYLLVINVGGWCIDAKCKDLDYDDYDYSIPTLKKNFMKFVDEKLEKEKEMTNAIEYKDFQLKVSINGDYLLGKFVQKDVSDIFARPVEELSVPELREKFRERVDYYLRTKKEDSTYDVVYRDFILKVKESSATEFNYSGQCDSGFWGNNNSLAELISDFRKFVDKQIEELAWEMKESGKGTFEYKDYLLEVSKKDDGYIGVIKNSIEGVPAFYGLTADYIRRNFVKYIDGLEDSTKILNHLIEEK